MREYRIGTRASRLALWQSAWVATGLRQLRPDIKIELVPIRTKGDNILDTALAKIGDKGLFTKELESALLKGQVDMAVHSMKDLPTHIPQGLLIGAICQRECPADVLISKSKQDLDELPLESIIGTSSLRRIAQLKKYRPDLKVVNIRGNLNTRLKKLEEQNIDALVLAYAGIVRLGYAEWITQKIAYDICLPAVGQGAIGVEVREDDQEILDLLSGLDHFITRQTVNAERALLKRLEGGCQIPVGALAIVKGEELILEAMVSSLDGLNTVKMIMSGELERPEKLGCDLAEKMLAQGAEDILKKVRQEFDINGQ